MIRRLLLALTPLLLGSSVFACPVDISNTLTRHGLTAIPRPLPIWWNQVVWHAHQDVADQLWKLYKQGKLSIKNFPSLEECFIQPISDKKLFQAINARFLAGSLSEIKKLNPKKFEMLSKQFDIQNMAFRILDGDGIDKEEASAVLSGLPAGFNMETRSLFINISAISRIEWNVIFIHEMGHFIDSIENHIEAYNAPKVLLEIDRIITTKTVETLTKDESEFIDNWLLHGLNIGLLAELRTWNFTVEYLAGTKKFTLGPRTKWLQPIIDASEPERKRKIFEVLNDNTPDPTSGRFSNPIIRSHLTRIRQNLSPENGNLSWKLERRE